MEKFKVKFEDLRVGQKVWTIQDGEVTINLLHINYDKPIEVYNGASYRWYSKDGFFLNTDEYPSLYLSNPFEQYPYSKGEYIMVWDNIEAASVKRIFLCVIDNAKYPIVCVHSHTEDDFKNGLEFSLELFKNASKIEEKIEPLTLEQRIEKLESIINNQK